MEPFLGEKLSVSNSGGKTFRKYPTNNTEGLRIFIKNSYIQHLDAHNPESGTISVGVYRTRDQISNFRLRIRIRKLDGNKRSLNKGSFRVKFLHCPSLDSSMLKYTGSHFKAMTMRMTTTTTMMKMVRRKRLQPHQAQGS